MPTSGAGWRRVHRYLVLGVVQALTLGALSELGLRVIGPGNDLLRVLLYEPTAMTHFQRFETLEQLLDSSILGFRPCQEAYGFTLNSRSLRTSEYDVRKARGATRVIVLGDSFTFASGGLPHSQHWPTLLEQRLNSPTGDGGASGEVVEVLRLGVPGTGTLFQRRLWQLEGARLDADLVILGLFVGNDLLDEQGAVQAIEHSVRATMCRQSYLLRAVYNGYRLLTGVEPGKAGATISNEPHCDRAGAADPAYAERFDPDAPSFTLERYLEIQRVRLSMLERSRAGEVATMVDGLGPVLIALDNEVRASGARFIVMLIPDELQVDAEQRRLVLTAAGLDTRDLDLDLPQEELIRMLDSYGVEHLDLLPVFVENGADQRLYRPRDTHWNRAGNELAATTLERFLADRPEPARRPDQPREKESER